VGLEPCGDTPDKSRRLATPWPEALNVSISVFVSIGTADGGAVRGIEADITTWPDRMV